MSYIANCLRKYATFRGRASRREFWNFFGLVFLINIVSKGLDLGLDSLELWQLMEQIDTMEEISFGLWIQMWSLYIPSFQVAVLITLAQLIFIIPFVAVLVRRLHDTNRSGWFALLALIPLVNLICLAWCAQKGTVGENKYGVEPFKK